jgi:hypothetical protein
MGLRAMSAAGVSIDPSANADKNYAKLQKALAKLLKSYPPSKQ